MFIIMTIFWKSKHCVPQCYKGLKAWVALHAVPHGGMTNERTKKKKCKKRIWRNWNCFAVVCFDGTNVVVGNGS